MILKAKLAGMKVDYMPHDFSPEAQAARRAPPNVAALSVKELKTRLRACGIDSTASLCAALRGGGELDGGVAGAGDGHDGGAALNRRLRRHKQSAFRQGSLDVMCELAFGGGLG